MKKITSLVAICLMLLISTLLPVNVGHAQTGLFIRPVEGGKISSHYGFRSGSFHHGIDIAEKGTVPIKAAASGTVRVSTFGSPGNYNRYGNVIVIRHNIGGKTYETLYAHMSSRSVSVGTTVQQGQTIGYMGNTGESYGQHLHFEIHVGTWNGYKSNSTDPYPFISGTSVVLPKDDTIQFEGMELKRGQLGVLIIDKPINLWKRNEDNSITPVRVLNPGEKYRVYTYDELHGGQYGVGSGYYVTKMDGYITYRTPSKDMLDKVNNAPRSTEPVWWNGMELKKGQIGRITVLKPINLWKRDENDKITMVRILNPGEVYRVYGYDNLHGGQYNVGDDHWITKMDGYIKYETPSQEKIEEANR